MIKLNLGCGNKSIRRENEEWLNVDYVEGDGVDVVWDLENFPWPFAAESSVDEIVLSHVLEHIGQHPGVFIRFMKELYRVCGDGALVSITVPHPRHDAFLGDPTHVRPITLETMTLFSRSENLQWQKDHKSNTPLALRHGVDFETEEVRYILDEKFLPMAGRPEIQHMLLTQNNVCREIRMKLRVRKSVAR